MAVSDRVVDADRFEVINGCELVLDSGDVRMRFYFLFFMLLSHIEGRFAYLVLAVSIASSAGCNHARATCGC